MSIFMLSKLLEELIGEHATTEEELSLALVHLFTNKPAGLTLQHPKLLEAISFLRELVVAHELHTMEALAAFFAQREDNMMRVLDQVIEESQDVSTRVPVFAFDSGEGGKYYRSLLQNSLQAATMESLYQLYDKLYQYLGQQWQLKDSKMVLINLKKKSKKGLKVKRSIKSSIRFLLEGAEDIDYWQQFTQEKQKGKALVMVGPHHGGGGSAGTDKMKEPSPSCKSFAENLMSHYFDVCITQEYVELINILRHERPIPDKSIKRRITDWLLWVRMKANPDGVAWLDVGMDPALSTISTVWLTSHGQDHVPVDRLSEWINTVFEEKLLVRKWVVLKSPEGYSWLTSDNPGFNLHLDDVFSGSFDRCYDSSWINLRDNSILYFPLSKEYCLRLQPNGPDPNGDTSTTPIEFEQSPEKEVDVVNMLTLNTRDKVVIASSRKMLEQYQLI